MPKSMFGDPYAAFVDTLVRRRKAAGLTQTDLATRVGREQQFISRIERRLRRLDVVEFYVLARALGIEPGDLFREASANFPDRIEI